MTFSIPGLNLLARVTRFGSNARHAQLRWKSFDGMRRQQRPYIGYGGAPGTARWTSQLPLSCCTRSANENLALTGMDFRALGCEPSYEIWPVII
jgi:hypothetical protein